HLERVLDAQEPLSDAHDELLFIIQHQTSELWMKLAIHEIRSAIKAIRHDQLQPAFKMLSRIARIFEQLNTAWDVLRTMTPSEYTEFRDQLGQSSGFQSYQYRAIEFLAGNRNLALLAPHAHRADITAKLEEILAEPGLYDEALLLLARNGFDIGEDARRTDWRVKRTPNDEVLAAWKTVYASPAKHWMLYEFAEKLVDFEDYFRRWRFNHVTTVERIIGLKRGTGGTSGVSYLRKRLERYPSISTTYQVNRTRCAGLAPPSARISAMLESVWRVCATKSGARYPCVSQPITPPVTTSRPSAAMPLAYPFGTGQPLGCNTCGPGDEVLVLGLGTTLSVGPLGAITVFLHQVRRYSAATLADAGPAAAICLSAKRLSFPVSVFGSCATYSIARGYLYGAIVCLT